MAPSQDTQLEKILEEVLKSGDVHVLDGFLKRDIYGGTPMKCSKQFLSKLDELVCRSLDQKDSRSARLGLTIVYKCGENLKLPDENQGLSGLIGRGLIKKWFEKCRQLWIQCGPQWDEPLFNLSEDFFEVLMVVHEACKEGTYQITESFLYPVGQLGVDQSIYILIQKEAIRKFNLILDKIPVELAKERKILTSQKASDIMNKLAGQILKGGDYDLQTALMEALCRMATPAQRKDFADQWFSMEHVANAFVKICDLEFETDCRKFLNLVNGMQGDRRRVYSYPCLEVYLDKYELLMPVDEKLEEFWIDFNLGSNSISFYFSLPDKDTQHWWETICIQEHGVQSYTVTEQGKTKILQLKLSEVVVVGAIEGSNLAIHFSSSLDILQAARSVYGQSRNKGFERKTSTSVVKRAVKVIVEENCTQTVVPESQVSLGDSEKNTAPYLLPASSAPSQNVTPAKMRMSESTTVIRNSARGSAHDASFLSAFKPSNAPAKSKGKPSLEMVRSCDSNGEFCVEDPRVTAKTPSHGTKSKSTKAGGMLEKKIPGPKAVDIVLAGQGEEQSLECNFVPDTQPRPVKNISANWSKLSVSEMLTMPTQEIKTRPGEQEPHSNLAQQQRDPTLARPLSVPGSDPVSLKQLHSELTQRLQQVITQKNQGHTPRKPAATQRKLSSVRKDLESKNSADQHVSTLCTPKVQQAQSKGSVKGKSKCRTAQKKTSVVANKSPIKGPMTKALQEKIPPNIKAETKRPPSSKDKKDEVVTGCMMKTIASHYELNTRSAADATHQSWVPPVINRQIFNMSWFSAAKKSVSHTTASLTKTFNNTASKPSRQRRDIFAFTSESPLSTGGKNKPLVNTSAVSSSDVQDSSGLHSTSKKGQSVAKKKTRTLQISQNKEKQHVKKHLFSDTDMDCATSEVSWLKESSRKPKPVTKYSRPAPIKPKAVTTNTSYDSLDSPPPPPPKHVKGKTKPNKKNHKVEGKVEQPKKTVKPAAAPNGQHAAGRRPKRAAALSTKTYKEPDSDDSQSELEKLPAPKTGHLEITKKTHEASHLMKKKTASNQPTKRYVKPERDLQSRELESEQTSTSKWRPENILQESLKSNKKNDICVREQTSALKDSWAARQSLFCPSPPFIDRMRSAERSAPTLDLICSPLLTLRESPLPASPDPACQDTPSPILLLPKPRSTGSNEGNFKPSSLYSAEKKPSSSKPQSVHSVPSVSSLRGQTSALQAPIRTTAAEISPVQQCPSPAPPSPLSLSLPLLASTLLDVDMPSMPSPTQSPFPENNDLCYGLTKVSSVSQVSLSQSSTKSSVLSCRVRDSYKTALTVSCKTEKTPPSDREINSSQLDTSGPSRKRHISSTSNSDEDEKEERKKSKMRREHSPRMKPRKLFKSFTEVLAAGEVSQVMSPTHTVTSGDMDEDLEFPECVLNQSNLYQQFSTDLKKKFQNRYQMMEDHNNQSLIAVQQHVSSLNIQVTKYRTQRLSQIQKVLLGEINKLEQDDTALKRMEKDLTIHWKEQTVAFRSYWEQQTMRDETLKKALQNNLCHSLEYENKIFTSQMCLVRKDMKSVQDRLLCEMQEREVQSVKSGLYSLFFPDGARF